MEDATDDTDAIERDLAATRERMDRRLDELGDRLAPNQLVSDALAQMTGGDGAQFTRTLIAKAKANPIPAALAGVGIAWLMASGRDGADRAQPDLSTRLRSAEQGVVRIRDEDADVHAARIEDARGQVLGIARNASDTTASYAERIREATAAATRSLHGAERHPDGASVDTRRGGRFMGDPVVLGGVAVIAGLVAGALIPLSRQEERALGATAGGLQAQGRDLAQGVMESGALVAADVVDAVREGAHTHGLTADRSIGELVGDLRNGDLVGHVREIAQEVANVGAESVRSRLRDDEDGGEPARD